MDSTRAQEFGVIDKVLSTFYGLDVVFWSFYLGASLSRHAPVCCSICTHVAPFTKVMWLSLSSDSMARSREDNG